MNKIRSALWPAQAGNKSTYGLDYIEAADDRSLMFTCPLLALD